MAQTSLTPAFHKHGLGGTIGSASVLVDIFGQDMDLLVFKGKVMVNKYGA